MKKTYQTPVITVIEIAVESQILAGSTSLEFGKDSITDPSHMDDEEEEDDGSYWK